MEDKQLKALVSLLSDDDREVLEHVEQKIISLGGSIIPMLESEWENNFNPTVQRRIEDLIHHLQYEQLLQRLKAWHADGCTDLLEGLWIIATYQYPDLELSKLKQQLEQIYYECWLEYRPGLNPFDQVRMLNHALFTTLKFSGNTKNFHAPANSMINIVLESKKGNHISLSCIYMMVAQKLQLPVYGVNMPNMFILTYKKDSYQFYINPFNKGILFSKDDIDNYIKQLNIEPRESFYEPCTNEDIILRVLRNLINSFDRLSEKERKKEIIRMYNLLLPESEHFDDE